MEDRADIEMLLEIFFKVWSLESSSKWTKENPASGQCGVTSLVAHDLLGGEILKTQVEKAWHFYNRIDHKCIDFTESQFVILPDYEDRLSSREKLGGSYVFSSNVWLPRFREVYSCEANSEANRSSYRRS